MQFLDNLKIFLNDFAPSPHPFWASLVALMVKNLFSKQENRFNPWMGKITWRMEWLATPVFLPGEFHGQRSLAGYSIWGNKELDVTEHTPT